ncbi:MAG: PAS domain S-box protein [Symploca sp. SIO1A3]|nr:PAS domain S-box protein [Symploca sp. SIO1A3]
MTNNKQLITNNKPKGNILVVDDTPANLNLLTSMLSEHGYKVRLAPNGKLALRSVQSNPPEAILLDILMPEMDGYQVCEKLKTNRKTSNIPVIFLSALHEVSDKVRAFQVGGVDYITKPFQLEEVLTRVENQLKISRLQKQLTQHNALLQQEIKERQQVEEKLRTALYTAASSQASLAQAQRIAHIGSWEYHVLTDKFTWSEELFRIFGLEPNRSEPSYTKLLKRIHPDDRSLWQQTAAQMIEEGTSRELNFRIVQPNGQIRQVEGRGESVVNATGQVIRLLGTVWDITERYQAKLALQASEQKYRNLVETSQDMIWSVDSQGYYTFVNQAAKQIYGYEPAEMLNHLFTDFLPRQQKHKELAVFQELMKTGSIFQYETTHLTKDGRSINLMFNAIAQQNEQGRIIGITGTTSDISYRVQAQKALRQSEERFALAVAGANDGIWDWDLQSRKIYFSPRWKSLLGYADDQLASTYETWEQSIHPEDVDRVTSALDAYLEGHSSSYKVEYRARCQDHTYRWMLIRGSALRDESGKPYRLSGSKTDITERKQREDALRLIVEGTASSTGMEFFRSCVRYLAQVLQVHYALVTEFANESKTRIRTLAFWTGEEFSNNIEYEIAGTPCAEILAGINCHYPQGVQQLFPEDQDLFELGVESYWGIPLKTSDEQVLGHLSVLDVQPMAYDPGKEMILQIFAARAAAELERQQTDLALKLSNERLQYLLHSSPAVIYSVKASGDRRTTFVSENISALVGYEAREFLEDANFWHNHVHPEDIQNLLSRLPQLFEQGFNSHEYRFQHQEGTYRWLYDQQRLVRDATGNPIEFVGYWVDISDRKQAEQELQASQEKFAGILDIAEDAIISVDENQRIQLFNQGAEKIFGYTANEIIGQSLDILLPVTTRERHQQHICNFATSETKARKMANRSGNVFGCRKDGTQFPAEASISKLQLPEGALFTVMLKDISERQRSETTLQKALEAAEVANRAKSEFLANMSHELRTPLNAILGFTQVMSRDISVSTQQRQHLEIISRSGEHLLELINDILEMSKIEAGRSTFNQTSFDLYHLLEGLEEMLGLKAQAKGLQLMFEHVPELPQYVQTDEGKLRQVLINLLGNAIKFTQEGHVMLRVRLGRWGDGEMVRRGDGEAVSTAERSSGDGEIGGQGDKEASIELPILKQQTTNNKRQTTNNQQQTIIFEIEDTGPGIAPSELNLIFEPFTQTARAEKSTEGTGLGLPISRKFVELMGGQLTVKSVLAQGTVFRFDIPISLAEAIDQQKVETSRRVIGLAPNQRLCRILVVEDKWTNRLLLFRLLTAVGFSMREATNGEEAIALWESWEPHLILMDMRMPVMDGYEATKKIKSHVKGQATVIIALTASVFEEHRAAILSAGCDDFIRKPFRENFLLEKIADYLGVRYVYEEKNQPLALSHQASANAQNYELNAESLSLMPPEWISKLHLAAEACNDEEIIALIEQIPDQQVAVKSALTHLVDNFRVDLIFDLTQVFINE